MGLSCVAAWCALQVQVLPWCGGAEVTGGQLSLLATLRKFTVKCVGLPEPDREAAMAVVTQLAALPGLMAAAYSDPQERPGASDSSSSGDGSAGNANAGVLLQHVTMHLLPVLQVRDLHPCGMNGWQGWTP